MSSIRAQMALSLTVIIYSEWIQLSSPIVESRAAGLSGSRSSVFVREDEERGEKEVKVSDDIDNDGCDEFQVSVFEKIEKRMMRDKFVNLSVSEDSQLQNSPLLDSNLYWSPRSVVSLVLDSELIGCRILSSFSIFLRKKWSCWSWMDGCSYVCMTWPQADYNSGRLAIPAFTITPLSNSDKPMRI